MTDRKNQNVARQWNLCAVPEMILNSGAYDYENATEVSLQVVAEVTGVSRNPNVTKRKKDEKSLDKVFLQKTSPFPRHSVT